MKKIATLLALLVCSTAVFAQTATTTTYTSKSGNDDMMMGCSMKDMTSQQRHQAMQEWKNMTPAEKHSKMQACWQNMAPAKKQKAMDMMMMRWNVMSPAEQQQLMQRMQGSMKPMKGVMTPPPMGSGPLAPPAPGMGNGPMPPAPATSANSGSAG